MTLAQSLLPLSVLLPLGIATALLAVAHLLPPRAADGVAILTALGVALLCGWLSHAALAGPIVHWFGGWTPAASGRPGVVLGVSFVADPASAAVAAFCGLLFVASFTFAWGHFDAVHAHFHVLMLLFLAAMVGFCLTHDLFNLFVWFELMSVAAFALTAYPLGKSSLEGAFNFTIVNALASFLMLAGVGLLYARTGTLDFTELGRAVARIGSDAVLTGGFCLLAAALLTKAAILPFHLWLADAHAVAPSPVSVIFSGAMVSLGLFALAKLILQVFAHDPAILALVRSLLLWLGLATAAVGALMAWTQRHLKRLLAFSTIAHMGIMLVGVTTLGWIGTAGLLCYIAGHGLVKAALFMIAGMLLSLRASADEIDLYGQARALWPAGAAMALGGLLLGGLPVGLLHEGTHLVHAAAGNRLADAAIILSTALTGAAVLRAAGRIFLGWSGTPGLEAEAPTERDHEGADRPLWLMLAPCLSLLLLALTPAGIVQPWVEAMAPRLADPDRAVAPPLPPADMSRASIATFAATLLIFGLSLARTRPTSPWRRRLRTARAWPIRALQAAHSGLVADYVTWLAVGLALLAAFA